MGPTCSIVYENEPMEKNTMLKAPRNITDNFLKLRELSISILQGLAITAGVLFSYQWSVKNGGDEVTTRAMVFSTLIFANIFLSLVNRSFSYSMFNSFKNKNPLFPIIIITLLLLIVILYFEPVAGFFHVTKLSLKELGSTVLIAGISVLWFEAYKLRKRRKNF